MYRQEYQNNLARELRRSQPTNGRYKIGLRSASVGAEQTSPGRLIPPERKGTFDGRNGCRKCFCVTFDKSNKNAVFGESFLISP